MGITVGRAFLFIALIHYGFIDAHTLEIIIKAYVTQAPQQSAVIQTNDPCWQEIESLGDTAVIGCRGKINSEAQRALIKMHVPALDDSGNLTEDSIRALLAQAHGMGALQDPIFQNTEYLHIKNIKAQEQGHFTEQLFLIESSDSQCAQSRFILKGLPDDDEIESLVFGANHESIAPITYPRMQEGYPQIIFPIAYFSYKDKQGRTRHLSLMPVASGYKVVSLRNAFAQKATDAERAQMQRIISETYYEIGAQMARFYKRYAMSKQLVPMGTRHGDFHSGNIFYDPATRKITLIDNDHLSKTLGRAECVWRDFLPMIVKVKRSEPLSDHMYSLWFAASAPSFIVGFLSAYAANEQLAVLKELVPCIATYKRGERMRKREQIGVLKEALQAMGREFKDFFYYGDVYRSIKSVIAHRPLIATDVSVNAKDNKGMTILHEMVTKDMSLFWTVIAAGADFNARDNSGNTPLHLAVQNNKIDAIRLLLEAGADIHVRNRAGNTPLDLAVRAKNKEAIKMLNPRSP